MLPTLPPKRMQGADRELVHQGPQEGPERFLNLVAQHPPLCEDSLLKLFLSFSGPEVQNKLKGLAQCLGDEFVNFSRRPGPRTSYWLTSTLSLPSDGSSSGTPTTASRSSATGPSRWQPVLCTDLLIFGKALSVLGSDITPLVVSRRPPGPPCTAQHGAP